MVSPWVILTAAIVSLALGLWGVVTLSGDRRRTQDLEDSMGTVGNRASSSVGPFRVPSAEHALGFSDAE